MNYSNFKAGWVIGWSGGGGSSWANRDQTAPSGWCAAQGSAITKAALNHFTLKYRLRRLARSSDGTSSTVGRGQRCLAGNPHYLVCQA